MPERNLAIYVPYPDRSGGVSDGMDQLRSSMGRFNHNVSYIGPDPGKQDWTSFANYQLGRAVSINAFKTSGTLAATFNLGKAMEIVRDGQFDAIEFNEPAIAVPAVHTLETAANRLYEAGELEHRPVIGYRFHARIEPEFWFQNFLASMGVKGAKALGAVMRRLEKNPNKLLGYGWTRGFYNTMIESVDGSISVSDPTQGYVLRKYGLESTVILNGIDTEEMRQRKEPAPWKKNGVQTVFYSGRFEPRKGVKYLVSAYQIARGKMDNLQLVLQGPPGKHRLRIEKLIAKLRLPDVIVTDPVPRNELPISYSSADVFAAPATGNEAMGRVLQEAMACEVPQVHSDIDGFNVATMNMPFAVKAIPRDPNSLAEALIYMLSKPESERRALGRLARAAAVKNYSLDVIARQNADFYSELIDQKQSSSRFILTSARD